MFFCLPVLPLWDVVGDVFVVDDTDVVYVADAVDNVDDVGEAVDDTVTNVAFDVVALA